MKKNRWALLLFISVLFFSCKQELSSYTPYIQVSDFYLNPVFLADKMVYAEDTLSVVLQDGMYVIDSVNANDTVVFAAAFGSLGNDLTAARCNFDSTQLHMASSALTSSTFKPVLSPYSVLDKLQLVINAGYNYMSFPINCIPLKSGVFQFELVVESDSKFSPVSYKFVQPVR